MHIGKCLRQSPLSIITYQDPGTGLDITPVIPGGVSTALTRSCLIFQSTVRTQENHDTFRKKLSDTASLQQPMHCYGALMAFHRVPTVFMVEIHGASLRVHSAQNGGSGLRVNEESVVKLSLGIGTWCLSLAGQTVAQLQVFF